MQTEIEKRIEEYVKKNIKLLVSGSTEEKVLAGAKFILKMPELREAIRLVKSFYTEGDDTYCTCGVELGSDNSWKDPECLYHEAKANFERLKKAGLV